MKFMHIEKISNGAYVISDDISGRCITYYYYTLKQAIKEHRQTTGTIGKYFIKIYY